MLLVLLVVLLLLLLLVVLLLLLLLLPPCWANIAMAAPSTAGERAPLERAPLE